MLGYNKIYTKKSRKNLPTFVLFAVNIVMIDAIFILDVFVTTQYGICDRIAMPFDLYSLTESVAILFKNVYIHIHF